MKNRIMKLVMTLSIFQRLQTLNDRFLVFVRENRNISQEDVAILLEVHCGYQEVLLQGNLEAVPEDVDFMVILEEGRERHVVRHMI